MEEVSQGEGADGNGAAPRAPVEAAGVRVELGRGQLEDGEGKARRGMVLLSLMPMCQSMGGGERSTIVGLTRAIPAGIMRCVLLVAARPRARAGGGPGLRARGTGPGRLAAFYVCIDIVDQSKSVVCVCGGVPACLPSAPSSLPQREKVLPLPEAPNAKQVTSFPVYLFVYLFVFVG